MLADLLILTHGFVNCYDYARWIDGFCYMLMPAEPL